MLTPTPGGSMLIPGTENLSLVSALHQYKANGYGQLGVVVDPEFLTQLRARADELMLGKVRYEGLFFQLDAASGRYEDAPLGLGYQGPSLEYRKLEKLEKDPLFFSFLSNPLFERIARSLIEEDVVLYRAIIFNKGVKGGSNLPWHQDGGKLWGLTGEPTLQLWTALDDAPEASGCLEVLPGTHHAGLATLLGGVVPEDHVARARPTETAVRLPAKAGEVMLLHNHLWHRSGTNTTGLPRRSFSVCLMSSHIRCTRKRKAPRVFPPVFVSAGKGRSSTS